MWFTLPLPHSLLFTPSQSSIRRLTSDLQDPSNWSDAPMASLKVRYFNYTWVDENPQNSITGNYCFFWKEQKTTATQRDKVCSIMGFASPLSRRQKIDTEKHTERKIDQFRPLFGRFWISDLHRLTHCSRTSVLQEADTFSISLHYLSRSESSNRLISQECQLPL
jgi:hypothetical protein